jgi:hypothetical protein
MSFLKKLFGGNPELKPEPGEEPKIEASALETGKEQPILPWLEASRNPWGIRLLDLRPITLNMLSSSKDPLAAQNAISYQGEDGSSFWGIRPDSTRVTETALAFVTEGRLEAGALFTPNRMEHKWAIYFDGTTISFVRSWQRKVLVIARTSQQENVLTVDSIEGMFTPDESPAFTKAILVFLLTSNCAKEIVPAPLPQSLSDDTYKAGLWAFSLYGNMAQVGVFGEDILATAQKPLRCHTLLHIAVARNELDTVQRLILEDGSNINGLAGDGLGPLHWSLSATGGGTEAMEKLLQLGADPDARSDEGATPLMNAVQSNKPAHVAMLLAAGAAIDARDNRGFTALHRASEMGHTELVAYLLERGADKTLAVGEHTALSFAVGRGHAAIVELLR